MLHSGSLCVDTEAVETIEHQAYNTIVFYVTYKLRLSGVAQRVGRGIALLFHDSGTRRG